jgi:hypothetical protein
MDAHRLSTQQTHFLDAWVQDLRDANANNTTTEFYEQFFSAWFSAYPELANVFPDAASINQLSNDDRELLEWHTSNRKKVRFVQSL